MITALGDLDRRFITRVVAQVDGVKNPLVQSLFLDDLPIHTAHWGGDGQYVVAGGRRKHIYVFDLAAQRCERVQGFLGAQERSYESFVVSLDAQRPCVAFLGTSSSRKNRPWSRRHNCDTWHAPCKAVF